MVSLVDAEGLLGCLASDSFKRVRVLLQTLELFDIFRVCNDVELSDRILDLCSHN